MHDGGPEHEAELRAFADAIARAPRDAAKVGAARAALLAVAGEEALHDAVATAAAFASITRVVDTSGHTDPMMEMVIKPIFEHSPPAKVLATIASVAVVAVGVALAALALRR